MNNNGKSEISHKAKLKIKPNRGVHDLKTITRILDDYFICHIGFVEGNQPFVIPTCYGRQGDKIFIHGAGGSRMLNVIKSGVDICITVTLVDGIVLARSAFNHSINYRSVVMFGKAEEITDKAEKLNALKVITEQIIPGRWDEIRQPDEKEIVATSVISFGINDASAKIRIGDPVDKEQDMSLSVWAGVLPLKLMAGEPITDPFTDPHLDIPGYLKNFNNILI